MAHDLTKPKFHPDFDDKTDDIVLRSSDDLYFRVHSVLLPKASAVFGDMLAKHQPISLNPPSIDTPLISLDEPQDILERGLRLITASLLPDTFPNIPSLIKLAGFCAKYKLRGCVHFLHLLWQAPRFTSENPLEIYKLACLYEWKDAIEEVAIRCIERNPSVPGTIEALDGLELRHYGRLAALTRDRTYCFKWEIGRLQNFAPCWRVCGRSGASCSSCKQNFDKDAWKAFRYGAILLFEERPGLTPFAPTSLKAEISAINELELVCDKTGSLDCTKIISSLERIVTGLPKT